jgi:fibronectin type 3 domain-containing protein
MKNSIRPFLLSLLLVLLTSFTAIATPSTLTWDPSPSSGVVGYKVYYRINTSNFNLPFSGTSLTEGTSPIFTSNTSLTLNIPEDGNIYYFTATAINSTGLESGFSNMVASEWIPTLVAPTNNAVIGTAFNFIWSQPPTGTVIGSYDLYYGTDPNLNETASLFTLDDWPNLNWPQPHEAVTELLVILLILLMSIMYGRFTRNWRHIRIGLCIAVFALQASCGGGGGSDGGTDSPLFTNIVTVNDTEYQINDLQPGVQYYWKVVAYDSTGKSYESITQQFTTQSN